MKKHISTESNDARIVGFVTLILLSFLISRPGLALELEAKLDWARQVELGTPVKGVVERVTVKTGQQVKQGEILLQLDSRGFKYRVDGLRAELEHLKAELDEAGREQDRALELYDRTVLSDHELQVAKNQYIAARAKFNKGKAELAQAELDLEYSAVRAPFDAVIIARQVEIGQIVVPDLKPATLFVVADARNMYAKARVDSNQLAKIAIGGEAMVVVKDTTYKGQVISKILNTETEKQSDKRKFLLIVEFPVEKNQLYSGHSVKIILP